MKGEDLKTYLDNIQLGMHVHNQIDIPNEVIDALFDKYDDRDDINQHEIVDLINQDIQDYIDGLVKNDEFKAVDPSKLAGKKEDKETKLEFDMGLDGEYNIVSDSDIDDYIKKETPHKTEMPDEDVNKINNELGKIAAAENSEDLQDVISDIPDIDVRLKDLDIREDEFNDVKKGVFELYKDISIKKDIDPSKLMTTIHYDNEKANVEMNENDTLKPTGIDKMNQKKEHKDLKIMFEDDDSKNINNKKENVNIPKEYTQPKTLKLTRNNDKGFAYSPAINITILLLLMVFFMMVIVVFVK